MGLHLTGKGSIWDAITGAANTGANAVVSGVKDIGDLFNAGVGAATGNDEATQHALGAIVNNGTGGSLRDNLYGLGQDVGGGLDQPLNTIGAGIAGVGGLAGYGWDSAFGTPAQANRYVDAAQQQANEWLTHGIGNRGGLITPQQAVTFSPKAVTKGITKGVADVAPYVIGAPEIGAIVDPVTGEVIKEAASPLVNRAIGAGTNFGVGAGSTAASQYADTGHVDVKEALKQGLTNAALATGVDLAKEGVNKGGNVVKDNITPLDESGHVLPSKGEEDLSALHDMNPNKPVEPTSTPEPTAEATPAELAQSEQAAAAIDQPTIPIDYSKVEGAGKTLQQAIQNKADEIQSMDASAKGGVKVPDGEGGYIRTSEHTPFYREYYAENGRAPTKAAYREYAEKLLRSGTDPESANYHSLVKHAEAEQELKAYQQADRQSGYNKVKVRTTVKGEQHGLPTPVIEKISSPEYAAKSEAGRFLQRIRDELPGLQQQIDAIKIQRDKLAKAKDINGMTELNAKTADLQLRYRQLQNMERTQSGEYNRVATALNDKFPDTPLYKNGKAPRGGNATISNVPVRGGSVTVMGRKMSPLALETSVMEGDIDPATALSGYVSPGARDYLENEVRKADSMVHVKSAATPAEPARTLATAPTGDALTPEAYNNVFGPDNGVHTDETGTSYSPEFDHTIRDIPQQQPRNLAGDEAAFNAIHEGKSMDEAVQAYQDATGVTAAEAETAVNRVAETGVGMGTQEDVLKRNPQYGKVDDFEVKNIKDASAKTDSYGRVLEHKQQVLNKAASGLSENDIQLLDQLRGRDPAEVAARAENPEQFAKVAAAAKDISDYSHEIRRLNGDDTIYRQNYGAGTHYANVTPGEQAAVDGYKSDLASTPGFSKERFIGDYDKAANQFNLTRKNANFLEDVAHDSRQTLNFVKDRSALRSISDLYGADKVSYGNPTFEAPKQLNGLKDVFASKEIAKKWDKLHPQGESNLSKILWKPFDTASSAATQLIVANPGIHGFNQFVQGFIASGKAEGPLGGLRYLKNMSMTAEERAAIRSERLGAGDHIATYGKDNHGIVSQMTHGISDINKKAMSGIDTAIRDSTYKTLREGGLDPREAVRTADRFLGDKAVMGDATKRFTIFLHYFKTMGGAVIDQVAHPVANAGTIINAVIAAGAVWAVDQALQNVTGNKDAKIHTPGELGLIEQGVTAGKNIAKGHYKDASQIVTNRVNPIIKEGAQQLFDKDLFTGKKLSTTGRLSHVENTVTPEGQAASKVNSGAKSVAEALLNQAGVFTPHAKGYQASSKIPALNTPNAKAGNGLAAQGAYFDTTEEAKKSLPGARQEVFDSILKGDTDENGKPVGRNDKQTQAHYADLASNPDILDAITKQKQLYAKQTGTPLDPLYSPDITPEQRQEFLHLQSLPYKGDDFIQQSDANAWVKQLNIDRAAYFKTQDFSGAPPSERVLPPTFDDATQADMDTASSLEGTEKYDFIKSHPNVQSAYDTIAQYTNDKRVAQGNAPFKLYPKADIETQGILDEYSKLPKGNGPKGGSPDRAKWITANPDKYAKMQNYLASLSEYELANSAGQDKYLGASPSQQELKAAYSLGKYDINKTTDASGKVMYAIDPQKAYQSNQNSSTFKPFVRTSSYASTKAATLDRNSRRYYSHAGKARTLKLHTNSQNRRVLSRTKLHTGGKVRIAKAKTGKLRIKSATIA